jgi:hypothetical protein
MEKERGTVGGWSDERRNGLGRAPGDGERKENEDLCYICLDPMEGGEEDLMMRAYCRQAVHAKCFSRLWSDASLFKCKTCGDHTLYSMLRAISYRVKVLKGLGLPCGEVVQELLKEFQELGQPSLEEFNPKACIHNFLFKMNFFVSCGDEKSLVPQPNTMFHVDNPSINTSISLYYRINQKNCYPDNFSSYNIFDDGSVAEFVFVNGITSVSLLIGIRDVLWEVLEKDIEFQLENVTTAAKKAKEDSDICRCSIM